MKLDTVLEIMQIQLKIWKKKKENSKNVDLCLIASICDIQEDITSVNRVRRILKNYENLVKK